MLVGDRMLPDDGIAPGAGAGDQAAAITVALDDMRELARAVGDTLTATGTGTTRATEDLSLVAPSDEVAKDLVAMAETAHGVYRESVSYVLESLEAYRDALLEAAKRYRATEEGVEDDLRAFTSRVDETGPGASSKERQAVLDGPADLSAPSADDGTGGHGSGSSGTAGTSTEDGHS